MARFCFFGHTTPVPTPYVQYPSLLVVGIFEHTRTRIFPQSIAGYASYWHTALSRKPGSKLTQNCLASLALTTQNCLASLALSTALSSKPGSEHTTVSHKHGSTGTALSSKPDSRHAILSSMQGFWHIPRSS